MQLVLPKGKVKGFLHFSFSLFSFVCVFIPEVQKEISMNISINQQPKDIPDQCSLEQLLTQVLNIPVAVLAVAVDQTVIPSTEWPAYIVRPADKVMRIRATQGG